MSADGFIAKDVIDSYGRNPDAPAEPDRASLPPSWPPGATPGGTYQVSRAESVSVTPYPYVFLPDNFVLRLDSDVDEIQWQIGLLEFGKNVLFDVSRFHPNAITPPYPPAPPEQPPIPGTPSFHAKGAKGLRGQDGVPGAAGRVVILNIANVASTGGLWIRTDGAFGGLAGMGGTGQTGGDGRCEGDPRSSNGGEGGNGGDGGNGGKGGSTASVLITIQSLPVGFVQMPVACASGCGNSARPVTANLNNGAIAVWGGCGCGGIGGDFFGNPQIGGIGGMRGEGGGRAQAGQQCSAFGIPPENWPLRQGNPGVNGRLGQVGAVGDCGSVKFCGPPARVRAGGAS